MPKKLLLGLLTTVAVAAASLIAATTSSAAVPQNTARPSVGGTAKESSTLTASDGAWSNSPTSFSYHWQRCANDGTRCANITGATSKTYTLVSADVGHTVRVMVVASNADGTASATSEPTGVVGSKDGPANDVKPSLGGGSKVGDTVTVGNGLWTPTPTSYGRQWQRCSSTGANCRDIAGANGKSYNLAGSDVGHRIRALVTAHTSSGQTTVATNPTAVVSSSTTTTTNTTTTTLTTTTTVTTTTPAPQAPTVRLLALKRVHNRVAARFRVCVQQSGRIRITERDHKSRALPYTRHFTVFVGGTCKTTAKSWPLLARFRSRGRLLVTMRARDDRGLLSRLASRSIVLR